MELTTAISYGTGICPNCVNYVHTLSILHGALVGVLVHSGH